jgi:hypothetical protein
MLHPRQVRQIITLGFLFLITVALLGLFPSIQKMRKDAYRVAAKPTPPSIVEAPAPPPSPHPAGTVLFHGALKDVRDLTPLEEVEREPAYAKLLAHAAQVPEENLRSSCEGELAYGTYIKYAPELRGRIFRVRGILLREGPQTVRLTNPVEGREDVYSFPLVDFDREGGFVCDVADRPTETIEKDDAVEVEGFFYKIVTFETKRRGTREAPLIVARSCRKLPPAEPPPEITFLDWLLSWMSVKHPYDVLKLAVIAMIIATLVISFFILRNMRLDRESLHRYRPRIRKPPRKGGPPPAPEEPK